MMLSPYRTISPSSPLAAGTVLSITMRTPGTALPTEPMRTASRGWAVAEPQVSVRP